MGWDEVFIHGTIYCNYLNPLPDGFGVELEEYWEEEEVGLSREESRLRGGLDRRVGSKEEPR